MVRSAAVGLEPQTVALLRGGPRIGFSGGEAGWGGGPG